MLTAVDTGVAIVGAIVAGYGLYRAVRDAHSSLNFIGPSILVFSVPVTGVYGVSALYGAWSVSTCRRVGAEAERKRHP